MWQDVPVAERQKMVRQLIREAEASAREQRGGKPVLGVARILAQDPLAKPEHSKHSPRPVCHASSRAACKAYATAMRELAQAYAQASDLFRAGDAHVAFPELTFRPPVPLTWRAAAPPAAAAA